MVYLPRLSSCPAPGGAAHVTDMTQAGADAVQSLQRGDASAQNTRSFVVLGELIELYT